MQFNTIALLFSVAALRAAAETTVDANDVPLACRNICQPTIDLSARCEIVADNDNSNIDDDVVYNSCFCREPSAPARINECATCLKANGMNNANDDDNEVAELMRDCGWNFATANTSGGPVPTPSPTGIANPVVPSVSAGVTVVPTVITTGGIVATISVPSVVVNTPLPPTNVPAAAGPMATPAVQALLIAGLAAALM